MTACRRLAIQAGAPELGEFLRAQPARHHTEGAQAPSDLLAAMDQLARDRLKILVPVSGPILPGPSNPAPLECALQTGRDYHIEAPFQKRPIPRQLAHERLVVRASRRSDSLAPPLNRSRSPIRYASTSVGTTRTMT
jgi:hypothetical protein